MKLLSQLIIAVLLSVVALLAGRSQAATSCQYRLQREHCWRSCQRCCLFGHCWDCFCGNSCAFRNDGNKFWCVDHDWLPSGAMRGEIGGFVLEDITPTTRLGEKTKCQSGQCPSRTDIGNGNCRYKYKFPWWSPEYGVNKCY